MATWVDIYNRLYQERIVFLGQQIDDQIVNQIIAVMLFSDSEDQGQDEPHSDDGEMAPGMAPGMPPRPADDPAMRMRPIPIIGLE